MIEYSDAVQRVFDSALANLKSQLSPPVFEQLRDALDRKSIHDVPRVVDALAEELRKPSEDAD